MAKRTEEIFLLVTANELLKSDYCQTTTPLSLLTRSHAYSERGKIETQVYICQQN